MGLQMFRASLVRTHPNHLIRGTTVPRADLSWGALCAGSAFFGRWNSLPLDYHILPPEMQALYGPMLWLCPGTGPYVLKAFMAAPLLASHHANKLEKSVTKANSGSVL